MKIGRWSKLARTLALGASAGAVASILVLAVGLTLNGHQKFAQAHHETDDDEHKRVVGQVIPPDDAQRILGRQSGLPSVSGIRAFFQSEHVRAANSFKELEMVLSAAAAAERDGTRQ